MDKYTKIFFIILGLSLFGSAGYWLMPLIDGYWIKTFIILVISIHVSLFFTFVIIYIDGSK